MSQSFDPLWIGGDHAHGKVHVNRFRVYFKAANWELNYVSHGGHKTAVKLKRPEPKSLGAFLLDQFDETFSGTWPGALPGERNPEAVVAFQRAPYQIYGGHPTLKFTANVMFQALRFEDKKDDWVGICGLNDGRGLAAQTLQLRPAYKNDPMWQRYFKNAPPMLLPNPAGVLPPSVGERFMDDMIGSHILAGRRSWVIYDVAEKGAGPEAAQVASRLKKGERVFFFETAAIERFSSWVVQLTSPVVLWEWFHTKVIRIWSMHLRNFARRLRRPIHQVDHWQRYAVGAVGNQPPFAVLFQQSAFDVRPTVAELSRTEPWVGEVMRMHPHLREQLAAR